MHPLGGGGLQCLVEHRDPRLAELGFRIVFDQEKSDALIGACVGDGECLMAEAADYQAHRIGLGVPEEGLDYVLGDTFPHEALFDQLAGVSFSKGCFVGQEVVSRMQHRGTARKRIVRFTASMSVGSGVDVLAGTVPIGRTGSVTGDKGLALVRLDRAAEGLEKGLQITADGAVLALSKPEWAKFEFRVAGSDIGGV